jgi:ribosome modulation factor
VDSPYERTVYEQAEGVASAPASETAMTDALATFRSKTQHAGEEEAIHSEGACAFAAGRLMSACPYPAGSPQRDAWLSGWFDMSHAMGMLPDD